MDDKKANQIDKKIKKHEQSTLCNLLYLLRCNMTSITRYIRLEDDNKNKDKYKSLADTAVSNILQAINVDYNKDFSLITEGTLIELPSEVGITAFVRLGDVIYPGYLYQSNVKPGRFYRHRTQWTFEFESRDFSGIGGGGYTMQEALEDARRNLIEYCNSFGECL